LYILVISLEENLVTRGCVIPVDAAETIGTVCDVPTSVAVIVGIGWIKGESAGWETITCA